MREIAKRLICGVLASAFLLSPCAVAKAEMPAATSQTKTEKKKSGKDSRKNSARSGKKKTTGKSGKQSSGKKKSSGAPQMSSGEMKKRQKNVERDIRNTKALISRNENEVASNLADLQKIGADIEVSNRQISDISTQVKGLDRNIGSLENTIAANEAQLARLRATYLKAIKKMRLSRSGNSRMAFIFSSGSFNEALRRMRYMKKFSEWKERQSEEIARNVEILKGNRQKLTQAKTQKNHALAKEVRVKKNLDLQHKQKDNLVARLRADNATLREVLAKKQAEADALRGQIAATIVREEQMARERREREEKALRERQQREEQQRLAAEEKARRDVEAKELAAAEKAKAEAAAGKAERKNESSAKKKNHSGKENARKKKDNRRENLASSKTASGSSGKVSSSEYAAARKRRSRSSADNATPSETNAKTPAESASSSAKSLVQSSGSGFEKSRGALPRPCSGSWKIVSPFGRHSVPGLPDVVYDNPGIDVETSPGASALAVYPGKVSGVYVLPGYSTVVIVSHGSYYTVYGNIASPSVKTGDQVKQGHALGKLAVDSDDHSTKLHFEVWKNRVKLNPAEWVR